MARKPIPVEQDITGPADARTVYLLDVATDYEEGILVDWLARSLGRQPRTVRIRSSRRGKGGDIATLDGILTTESDSFMIPVRILWMPPERSGKRTVRWSDLILRFGDPRDPRGIRPHLIRNFRKDRVAHIVGAGAPVHEMASAHAASNTLDSISSFVTRRAWRALDAKERQIRGNRYKTPRFVPEAIFSRRSFQEDVQRIAAETGITAMAAEGKAARYLNEIAATHSPLVIDLVANAIHKLYRQGYGEIEYQPEQVQRLAEYGQIHPVVFLPSHRSNMDRLSLQFMLWENDLPPNHTAGGINLNFFPIGPLVRRTGVFFIRRSFRDNLLYKAVLQNYLDYLIEKRFNLEWYLEGGRSRSGRLLPPKLGMLNYVVDAQRRGKADDVLLIPISIAYDQIQDVPDYAREAQGGEKEKESIGWLFKAVRSMRQRYGDIHIRFGEPVSVRAFIEDSSEAESLAVPKMAFEVMYRIGKVTPVTPTAMVSIALLAARGKSKTSAQIAEQCEALMRYIEDRAIPVSEDFRLNEPEQVASVLDWLEQNENVSSHQALDRRIYWLNDEQMLRISYYRNVVVHHFLNRSIAEIALSGLSHSETASVEAFNMAALELRDLLKFEFFFPEKGEFLDNISTDLEIDVPGWRHLLFSSGPDQLIEKLGAPMSRWALVPFLDAYQIVADELVATGGAYSEKKFLKSALDRARMYRIEDETIAGESASQVLFKSALALAENRGLLEGPDTSWLRDDFADEIALARTFARTAPTDN
ncbi:MAG TPA: 1-acyl-sn-glycerol-3-phosphate acyltransferase [Acidimicrobiia bacterium]